MSALKFQRQVGGYHLWSADCKGLMVTTAGMKPTDRGYQTVFVDRSDLAEFIGAVRDFEALNMPILDRFAQESAEAYRKQVRARLLETAREILAERNLSEPPA